MVQMRGFEAAITAVKKYAQNFSVRFDQQLAQVTGKIFQQSQYYCPVSGPDDPRSIGNNGRPVDAGYLKSTGKAERLGDLNYRISYSAWYSPYVHEMPYRHTAPTRWKFLQQAVLDVYPEAFREFGPRFQAEYGNFVVKP
jgi:hypothetical protein